MSEVLISNAIPEDAETIAQYNVAMAKETEDTILDPETVLEGTKALFENSQYGFYVVAEVDKKVVGTLLVTYEWSDWRNAVYWWVQSVYVHPDHRRKGVFTALFEHVKTEAEKEGNVCYIRLYVENENLNAQKTYAKLGMKESVYKIFEVKL